MGERLAPVLKLFRKDASVETGKSTEGKMKAPQDKAEAILPK